MTILKLCTSCSSGVSGDDWTHLDMQCTCPTGEAHKDDCPAETEHGSIMAMLEYWGWLTYINPSERCEDPCIGYFDCALCSDVECSAGNLFSSEREPS